MGKSVGKQTPQRQASSENGKIYKTRRGCVASVRRGC